MAARIGHNSFRMSDEHRLKIANSNILKCLIQHAEGTREMTATQVAAGLGLLRKVLPDLAIVEMTGEVEHRFVARIPEPAANASEWLADQRPKRIEGTAVSSPHGETGEKISTPR